MIILKRKFVLALVILFGSLGSVNVALGADYCSVFLSNRTLDLPMSIVFQDSVHMSVDHMLAPGGTVKLHDLRQEALMNRSRV
jgi:hypothetical protein